MVKKLTKARSKSPLPQTKKEANPRLVMKLGSGVAYPPATIISSLQVVLANGYNIKEATRITGLSYNTLTKWAEMYNLHAAREGRLELLTELVNEDIEKKRERFEKVSYDVKEFLLAKVHAKAHRERDMDKLSRALKIVHEVSGVKTEYPTAPDNNPQNIITFMTQQITLHQSQKQEPDGTGSH